MSLPRSIRQPGPPARERVVAVPARGRAFDMVLESGLPLLEAVRRGFAAEGFTSGVVEIESLSLGPFAYVMPALATDGEHAAFYSDIHRPAGISVLSSGAMTFGIRDGLPFFHCHALWREADGTSSGGHILPDETIVARPARVTGFGIDGATFAAEPDPETNFKLFGPVGTGSTATRAEGRAIALRLRPNQDFCESIERICRDNGIVQARLRGGVGSTIGARFEDGRVVENFATELYIRRGDVKPDASGQPRCALDVSLIDYTGGIAEGRLRRGDNPVLMTMELVLEAL